MRFKKFRQKGAALIFAMAAMMTLIFISVTATRESTVEYVVSANSLNRVRAYWAARAGMEMALLRIDIYIQATENAPEAIKKQQNVLDLIWTFPLSYPFDTTLMQALGAVDKDLVQKTEKESILEGKYYVTIESEDSKLDINDLGSPSKVLREKTKEQILQIFANKSASDEDFQERYRNFKFETLVNNMSDWIDPDDDSREGGSEKALYSDQKIDSLPPNEPFKTLDEVRSVAGINDELFELLKPQITVYGIKAINVNQADADVLKSLNPQITDEVAQKIVARRNNPELGPFTDMKDFLDFISSSDGGRVNIEKFEENIVPLVFDATHNFRITSIGEYGNTRRVITAVTYDFDAIKNNLLNAFKIDDDKENPPDPNADPNANPDTAGGKKDPKKAAGTPPADPNKADPAKKKLPPHRPTIVYWNES